MKLRRRWWLAAAGILVALSLSGAALAQTQVKFTGMIDDYVPMSPSGMWHASGEWSLVVHGQSNTADFSAALAMVRSDTGASPHTHHITLAGGTVTPITNGSDVIGFRVTGTPMITGNGKLTFGGSTVYVDVTGGADVPFSNIKLTFTSPASDHFGAGGLHGVVQNPASAAGPAIQ